jgi:predicted RNase H-like HicB family nuclease
MRSVADKHLFPVIVERDEAGLFVATNPALPGCYSQGKSMEEALENVREATEACLTDRADFNPSNISVHVISV